MDVSYIKSPAITIYHHKTWEKYAEIIINAGGELLKPPSTRASSLSLSSCSVSASFVRRSCLKADIHGEEQQGFATEMGEKPLKAMKKGMKNHGSR